MLVSAAAVACLCAVVALLAHMHATYRTEAREADVFARALHRMRRDDDLGTALLFLLSPPVFPRHLSRAESEQAQNLALSICSHHHIEAEDLMAVGKCGWPRRTGILALLSGLRRADLVGPAPDADGLEVLAALQGLRLPDGMVQAA